MLFKQQLTKFPGPGRDAALPAAAQPGRAATSLALATKESLLEESHFGFQHVDLGLEFFGPGHGAPMLTAMIMGLLTQSDHFGVQKPILRLEGGLLRPWRSCVPLAR